MKEETLSEKREELFNKLLSKISVSFNDWQDYKKIIIEQDKQFIKEILDEIDYEMEDTADEKVSDETKSVLKVLKFKIKQKSGILK